MWQVILKVHVKHKLSITCSRPQFSSTTYESASLLLLLLLHPFLLAMFNLKILSVQLSL